MPFSWELAQQKANTTLIAILLPPTTWVTADWAFSFANMDKPPHDIMRLSGLPFDSARNQAAYQCLNGGYQWLYFADADVLPVKETIPQLISHRLPIVSALYYQRFPTWTGMEGLYLPCLFNEVAQPNGTVQKQPITDFKPGSLVECLTGDTFVQLVGGGLKKISEVKEGEKIIGVTLGWNESPKKDARLVPSTCLGIQKNLAKICIIETTTARIEATPNHYFFVRNKGLGGKVGWKQVRDINPMDKILILNEFKRLSRKTDRVRINPLSEYLKRPSPHCLTNHTYITPLIAQCLGYYLGDGTNIHNDWCVDITIPKGKGQNVYRQKFTKAFGIKVRTNNEGVSIGSAAVAHLIRELGLAFKSPERELPDWVGELDNRALARFIRGYFDADGCVVISSKKKQSARVTFSSTCKASLEKLKLLLLRFGIYSTKLSCSDASVGTPVKIHGHITGYGKHNVYTLTLSRENAKLFAIKIGSDNPEKKMRLAIIAKMELVNDLLNHRKKLMPQHSRKLRRYNQFLSFDQVQSIKEGGLREVFDIKTERQSFIANGVISHNCDMVPAGSLLIHRSVFERMLAAGIKMFFRWTLTAESVPPGSGYSEDFFFCKQARELGFKIFCDTSLVCEHETGAKIKDSRLIPKI
jgi:intein/homing endonuclease